MWGAGIDAAQSIIEPSVAERSIDVSRIRLSVTAARRGNEIVPREESEAPARHLNGAADASRPEAEPASSGAVQATANSPAASATVRSSAARTPRRAFASLVALVVLLAFACVVARAQWFTAGSEVGYWIGVAGGMAMLLLFAYPLRKRWRAAREFGTTRFWFSLHMMLGIVGPLLIIVHSTLRFGSVNATVAFVSMALVATSGVIGRFLYAQIHYGLYGRRASLADLRERAGFDSEEVRSKLAFAPEVERRLNEFARRAEETRHTGLVHPWRFLALGVHAAIERRRCAAEAARVLQSLAVTERWPPEKLARRLESRRRLIAAHLAAVQRVAQFTVFERLFSIWHVLHVPLVYMLVLSAIAHVVAVHMY